MKLRLYKEQASNLVIDALVHGIPMELIDTVLYLADKAYLCGYADREIERGENQIEYQLDMKTLEGIALEYIEGKRKETERN